MYNLLKFVLKIVVVSLIIYALISRDTFTVEGAFTFTLKVLGSVGVLFIAAFLVKAVALGTLWNEITVVLAEREWITVLELMEAIGEKRLKEKGTNISPKFKQDPVFAVHMLSPSIGMLHVLLESMEESKYVISRERLLDEAQLLRRGGRAQLEFKLTSPGPKRRAVWKTSSSPSWGAMQPARL